MQDEHNMTIMKIIVAIDLDWTRLECITFVIREGYEILSAIRLTDEAIARHTEGYEQIAS